MLTVQSDTTQVRLTTKLRLALGLATRSFWSPWGAKEGPFWAHVLLTGILNALVAAFIALGVTAFEDTPLGFVYLQVFPYAQGIGYSMMALGTLANLLIGVERVRCWSPLAQGIYWVGLPLLGGIIGFNLVSYLRLGTLVTTWGGARSYSLAASVGLGVMITFVFIQVSAAQGRANRAQAEADRERIRSLAAEARAAQATLRMMQAQIEPHFLFNTLANVASLMDSRPADAHAMLEDLIRYLRTSLRVARLDQTTLALEFDLLRAYLSVFRFRLGSRLRFDLELEEGLSQVQLAPMLLQPIVENALKHGIEPKVEGGTVEIRARRDDDMLGIEIADSGMGFGGDPGNGFGLTNVRERLNLIYGDSARMVIRENPGGGTVVALWLPLVSP